MRKWSELMEENKDLIVEKMVDAYKEAEGGMSGWHVGVEMDQSGDVWTTGVLSQGSQSESSWKGETTIVDWIDTWDVEFDEYQSLLNNLPKLDNIYEEYEQFKIDEDDEYADFVGFMRNRYPETLDQWYADERQFQIDGREEYARDKLDDIIMMQKSSEGDEE